MIWNYLMIVLAMMITFGVVIGFSMNHSGRPLWADFLGAMIIGLVISLPVVAIVHALN